MTTRIASRWCWTALVALVVSLPSFGVLAQPAALPTEVDKNRAAELVFQGDDKRKAGDHDAALESYQQADELMGVPTTGIEVARELAALGRLVEAHAKCATITNYPVRPGEPKAFGKARQAAGRLAAKLEGRIPTVQVRIRGATEATVELDGKSVPAIDEPIRLDPGEHTLVARAGSATATETITVAEGEERELEIVLAAEGDEAADGGEAPPDSSGLSPWVWVGFGVGGAGLIAGTITGALALQTTSVLSEECPNQVCSSDLEADVDKGVILSHVSTIGFAVGVAGVGVGVVALLLSSSDDDETAATLGVEPLVGPGLVGARGWFSP